MSSLLRELVAAEKVQSSIGVQDHHIEIMATREYHYQDTHRRENNEDACVYGFSALHEHI